MRTSDGLDIECLFAMDKVDDISLRRIGVAVFKDEDFVDSIFLQGREFDNEPNRPRQVLSDDQVLLASYLECK